MQKSQAAGMNVYREERRRRRIRGRGRRAATSPSLSFTSSMMIGYILLICGGIVLQVCRAIQLDIPAYGQRCIADDYGVEDKAIMSLKALGKVNSKVRATIQDPEGQPHWDGYLSSQTEEVPLLAERYGMYKVCFHNGGSSSQRVDVGLLDRLVSLREADAAKTKEHLRPLQVLFRRAELTVLGVSKELDNVKQREASLRDMSDTTDSRIQWFSIFSIVILLAVATWQVVFLKRFFRAKKLL